MIQHTIALPYDPNRLLDTLSLYLGTLDDSALGAKLRLSPDVIRNLRAGRLLLRPTILAAMAESTGKSLDELRLILGERRGKVRMPGAGRAA